MELSRPQRFGLICLLLTALFGLLILGGIDRPPAPELGAYPGADDIATQPDEYHNQRVSFGGDVVSTDPVIVEAVYETQHGLATIRLRITDLEPTVTDGDRLQIFGVLLDAETVRATNVVVVPRTDLWYAWSISAIAGLWVLGRLLRHWTIDTNSGAVIPRNDPIAFLRRRAD